MARCWITDNANTDSGPLVFCASADIPAAVSARRHHENDGERSVGRVGCLMAEASVSHASARLRFRGRVLHQRRSHHRVGAGRAIAERASVAWDTFVLRSRDYAQRGRRERPAASRGVRGIQGASTPRRRRRAHEPAGISGDLRKAAPRQRSRDDMGDSRRRQVVPGRRTCMRATP